jgi:hypothetical protein
MPPVQLLLLIAYYSNLTTNSAESPLDRVQISLRAQSWCSASAGGSAPAEPPLIRAIPLNYLQILTFHTLPCVISLAISVSEGKTCNTSPLIHTLRTILRSFAILHGLSGLRRLNTCTRCFLRTCGSLEGLICLQIGLRACSTRSQS